MLEATQHPISPPAQAEPKTAGLADARPRYLHFLQFMLLNVVFVALSLAAWLQGWLDRGFSGVSNWLCLLIIAVFLFGLMLCGGRLWQVVRELDALPVGAVPVRSHAAWYLNRLRSANADKLNASPETLSHLLRLRLAQPPSLVRYIAGTLVLLGLVGTVIGFIVAMSGVDPQKVPTANNVAPMVASLISGMSIALHTTLIGTVLHVWLSTMHRFLASASLALYQAILECGFQPGLPSASPADGL